MLSTNSPNPLYTVCLDLLMRIYSFITGALFAAVGCIESVALFIGASSFNVIYRDNMSTMSGFPFIIAALLLLVPAFLVG